MNKNFSDYEIYIKPIHLNGEAKTFTIRQFTEEKTHPQPGQAVTSLVVWFQEVPFGLILSPLNRQMLIGLVGDSMTAAVGRRITLKSIKKTVGGKQREPIQIVSAEPIATKAAPEPAAVVKVTPGPASAASPTADKPIEIYPDLCLIHNVKMIMSTTGTFYHKIPTGEYCNGGVVKPAKATA